jgi:hypothetical protein
MGTKCKDCGGGMLVLLDTYTCLRDCGGKKPAAGTSEWWPSAPVATPVTKIAPDGNKKHAVGIGVYVTVKILARNLVNNGGTGATLGELLAIVPAVCAASTQITVAGTNLAPPYQLHLTLRRGSDIHSIPIELAYLATRIIVRNDADEDATVLKDRTNG